MSSFRIDLPSIKVPVGLKRVPKENHQDVNPNSNPDNNHDTKQDIITARNNPDITTSLEQQRKPLTEHFQSELSLQHQHEQLKKVEKKLDDLILGRVPLLVSKSHTDEILSLRNGLQFEKRKRMENEKNFTEGIDKLLEEIGQLRLKVEAMQGRIEKSEKQLPPSKVESENGDIAEMITDLFNGIKEKFQEFQNSQVNLQRDVKSVKNDVECRLKSEIRPSPPPTMMPLPLSESTKSGNVAELMADLSIDVHRRMQEFKKSQTNLQKEIKRMKKDVDYLNLVMTPPVEAILEAEPEPPLGTPLLNLLKWGLENLGEILPSQDEPEVGPIPTLKDDDVSKPAKNDVKRPDIELANDEENVAVHKKAPTAGRYLPFMCQCGLEFDSEDSLSKHAKEETGSEKSVEIMSCSDSEDDLFIKITPAKPAQPKQAPSSQKPPKLNKAMSRSKKRLLTSEKSKERPPLNLPISNNEPAGASKRQHKDDQEKSTKEHSPKSPKISRAMPRSKKRLLMLQKSKRHCNLTSTNKRLPNSSPVHVSSPNKRQGLSEQDKEDNAKSKKEASSKPRKVGRAMPLSKKLLLMSQKSRRHGNIKSTFEKQPRPLNSSQIHQQNGSDSLPNSDNQHGLCRQDKDEKGNPLFVCNCGNIYGSKYLLKKHTGQLSKFYCNLCPKNFSRLFQLKEHIKSKHRGNSGQHFCKLCQKIFQKKKQLNDHRKQCLSFMLNLVNCQ